MHGETSMSSKSNSLITWYKSGSPWIWLNGGAVTLSMVMVIGLLALIAVRGFGHFWPADVLQTTIVDRTGERHAVMGEAVRSEIIPAAIARDNGYTVPAEAELVTRHLIKRAIATSTRVTLCGTSKPVWMNGNIH